MNKGGTATCSMEGYRLRKANVRWAYQPDGSRKFSNETVLTGNATLINNQLDRVSFEKGFAQVQGESDFLIYQNGKQLVIHNFDVGPDGPDFQEMKGVAFNALMEAPLDGYSQQNNILKKGSVFVFRTYDGKHYAKMEVL